MTRQKRRAKNFFVTLSLSLGYVAFGLCPQSTPPRDRTRLVNPLQRNSQLISVNIPNRVNLFQERTTATTRSRFCLSEKLLLGNVGKSVCNRGKCTENRNLFLLMACFSSEIRIIVGGNMRHFLYFMRPRGLKIWKSKTACCIFVGHYGE